MSEYAVLQIKYGEVTYDTTFEDYTMLTGKLLIATSIYSSLLTLPSIQSLNAGLFNFPQDRTAFI